MDTSRFRKKDSRKQKTGKAAALVLSFLLLTAVSAGGTIAYISTKTDAVTNTFDPSHVSCEATETFDGTVKSNVNVTNTGDIDAWLRVKLVTYRVNEEEQHIGGIAKIPDFTPGEGWVFHDGCYYYTLPVKPGEQPAADLINSIPLQESYSDADGGKQVIEVMAEAVQSKPAQAVGEAWKVTISEGSVTAYSGN